MKYRIFAVEDHGYGAILDTSFQEKVFEEIVSMNIIEWLKECRIIKKNPRLGDSRLDYLVMSMDKPIFIELKSAVLRVNNIYASYPDAPSARATKQFLDMIDYVSRGGSSIVVFMCSIPFIKGFVFNREIDNKLYSIVIRARESGVLFKAIQLHYDPLRNTVVVGDLDLPVQL